MITSAHDAYMFVGLTFAWAVYALVASRVLIAFMRWVERGREPMSSRKIHLTGTALAGSGYLFFLWLVQQVDPAAPALERPLRGLVAVAIALACVLALDAVTGRLSLPVHRCRACGTASPNAAKHCMECGAPLD